MHRMEGGAVDPKVVRHRRRLFVIFTLGLVGLVTLGAVRGGAPIFTWDERVYKEPVEVHLRDGSTIWIRKMRPVIWASKGFADGANNAALVYDNAVWVETIEGEGRWLSGFKSRHWWREDKASPKGRKFTKSKYSEN